MNLPKNFDQLNERRHALIDRKYSSNQGLSPAEEKELAELQEIAGQVRDALTPPLRPDIQATIDALKDPAKLEAIMRLPYKDVEEIPFHIMPGRYFHAMFYYPTPPSPDHLLGGNVTGLVWRLEDEPDSWRVVYRFRYYANLKEIDSLDSGDHFSWYTMHCPGAPPDHILEIMREMFTRLRDVAYSDGVTPNEPDEWSVLKVDGNYEKFYAAAGAADLPWLHIKRITPEEYEKRTGKKAPTLDEHGQLKS